MQRWEAVPYRNTRQVLDPALGGVLRPFFRNTSFYKPWEYGNRKTVRVSLEFPPGNVIERADSLMQRFEKVALASESVYRTNARISESSAYMTVEFKKGSLMTSEPYILQRKLVGQAILLGGMSVYVSGIITTNQLLKWGGGRGQQRSRTSRSLAPITKIWMLCATSLLPMSSSKAGVSCMLKPMPRLGLAPGFSLDKCSTFRWGWGLTCACGGYCSTGSLGAFGVFSHETPINHRRHRGGYTSPDSADSGRVPVRLDIDRVTERPACTR